VPDFIADYLVIGSGMAGLWFSYRAGRAGSVLLITKKEDTESNTNYAQGGIAAAVDDDDSTRLHYEDTIRAGAGIAHPDAVRIVTESGPQLVRELLELGVGFTTYEDATGHRRFDLGQEGGHRRRRIVHAHDFTGLEIERGLLSAVRTSTGVRVLEQHLAIDLVRDERGRCGGALILNRETGRVQEVQAGVTLLATGGIGQAWRSTTNPPIATGDGIAMAYRAGARVANMEFVQFHPTALYGHRLNDRAFLVSEAVRGEGAILRTQGGRAFMPEYHEDADLAPRDVVARAIAHELHRSGEDHVLLDATHLDPERVRSRFPNIFGTCLKFGLDMTRQPLPVVPAAHYVCGGVQTNAWAETSIPGLYAAGECACSGLHGANRLASNSLLEALVFADRAATRARETPPSPVGGASRPDSLSDSGNLQSDFCNLQSDFSCSSALPPPSSLLPRLQDLMWQHAGIVRTDSGLELASAGLDQLERKAQPVSKTLTVPAVELHNLLTVARLVVECARRRRESRGLHFNEDHPEPDDRFAHDTLIDRSEIEPAV
jgi:L-aspartate oxidase